MWLERDSMINLILCVLALKGENEAVQRLKIQCSQSSLKIFKPHLNFSI